MKCLIVDDEPIAREGIISYIEKVDFLEVAGVCSSAIEAGESLKKLDIDLILLDIQMPHLTGLEFLETLDNSPLTILTTAYSEFALEAFRLQVVDYLMKPITFPRFFQAVSKARDTFNLKEKENGVRTDMYVRQGDSFVKIAWADILYIESMQNYLKLHFAGKTLVIHQTMASIEEMLPREYFFRIHKSFLVNITHISMINRGRLFVNDKELPVSRQRRDELLNTVVYKKLISK